MTNKLLSSYNYPPAIPPSRPCRIIPGCQNLTQAGKLEQAGLEAGIIKGAGKLGYRGPGCSAPWAAPLLEDYKLEILNKNLFIFNKIYFIIYFILIKLFYFILFQ